MRVVDPTAAEAESIAAWFARTEQQRQPRRSAPRPSPRDLAATCSCGAAFTLPPGVAKDLERHGAPPKCRKCRDA